MKRKKAVCTLTIGKHYENLFEKNCKNNWQQYCDKHSFDLVVITHPLDTSERATKRSPAWQKLLILSQPWSSDYEQVIWIDSDVIINPDRALDPTELVPINKVGAVDQYSIPTRESYKIALERAYEAYKRNNVKYVDNLTPELYYQNRGINCDYNSVVQTGVFVCSPSEHKDIFEFIYYTYEDNKGSEYNYEMPFMSYELIKNNLVEWIAPEYNFCVNPVLNLYYPEVMQSALSRSLVARSIRKLRLNHSFLKKIISNITSIGYFTHFAGCSHLMHYLR